MTQYLIKGTSVKSKSKSSHPADKPTRDNSKLERTTPDSFAMLQGTVGNRRTGEILAKARPDYPATCAPGPKLSIYEIQRKTMNLNCPYSCDMRIFDEVTAYNNLPFNAKRPEDLADQLIKLSGIIENIINISHLQSNYKELKIYYSDLKFSASNEFAYVARQFSGMVESCLDSAMTHPEPYLTADKYKKSLIESSSIILSKIDSYSGMRENSSVPVHGDYFPMMANCHKIIKSILDYELTYIHLLFSNYNYLHNPQVQEIVGKHNIVFSLDPSSDKLESSLIKASGDCFNFDGTPTSSGYVVKDYIRCIRIADFKSDEFAKLLEYLNEMSFAASKSAPITPICLLDDESLKKLQKIYLRKNHIILIKDSKKVFSEIKSRISDNRSKQALPSSGASGILPYELPGLHGHTPDGPNGNNEEEKGSDHLFTENNEDLEELLDLLNIKDTSKSPSAEEVKEEKKETNEAEFDDEYEEIAEELLDINKDMLVPIFLKAFKYKKD